MMNIENKVLSFLKTNNFNYKFIKVDDLVFSPFTRFKCMQCANYHSTYGCPPFTPTWKTAKQLLAEYDKLLLVWRYIDLKKYIDNLVVNHKMEYSPRVLLMAQTVCDRLAKGFDKYVLECVKMLESSGFEAIALLSGGGCRRCKRVGCSLWQQRKMDKDSGEVYYKPRPCKYVKPESAMEAWGIAVYDTLRKLGIEFEPVPRTKAICVMLLAWKEKESRNVKKVGIERWLYV